MNSAENIGRLPLQSSDSDAVSSRTLTTCVAPSRRACCLHAHDGFAPAALEQRLVSHEAAADEALQTRGHALEIVLGDHDRADDERRRCGTCRRRRGRARCRRRCRASDSSIAASSRKCFRSLARPEEQADREQHDEESELDDDFHGASQLTTTAVPYAMTSAAPAAMFDVEKRMLTTALAPAARACSTMRSIASVRDSLSSAV